MNLYREVLKCCPTKFPKGYFKAFTNGMCDAFVTLLCGGGLVFLLTSTETRAETRQCQHRLWFPARILGFLHPICFPSSFADKAKLSLRPQQRKPPQLLQWPERTPPNLSGRTDPSGNTRCCCCPLLPRAQPLPPLENSPRSRA